jgi:hypothetical protein
MCKNYNFKGRKSCNRCRTKRTTMEARDDSKRTFMFPTGGWECSSCCNYNFKGRKECKRCHKEKTADDLEGVPDHIPKDQLIILPEDAAEIENKKKTFMLFHNKRNQQVKSKAMETTNEESIFSFEDPGHSFQNRLTSFIATQQFEEVPTSF